MTDAADILQSIGDIPAALVLGQNPVFDPTGKEIGWWQEQPLGLQTQAVLSQLCAGNITMTAQTNYPPETWYTYSGDNVLQRIPVTQYCLNQGYIPPWISAPSGSPVIQATDPTSGAALTYYLQPDGTYGFSPANAFTGSTTLLGMKIPNYVLITGIAVMLIFALRRR